MLLEALGKASSASWSADVPSAATRALRDASSFSNAGGFAKVAAPETGALQKLREVQRPVRSRASVLTAVTLAPLSRGRRLWVSSWASRACESGGGPHALHDAPRGSQARPQSRQRHGVRPALPLSPRERKATAAAGTPPAAIGFLRGGTACLPAFGDGNGFPNGLR